MGLRHVFGPIDAHGNPFKPEKQEFVAKKPSNHALAHRGSSELQGLKDEIVALRAKIQALKIEVIEAQALTAAAVAREQILMAEVAQLRADAAAVAKRYQFVPKLRKRAKSGPKTLAIS